MDGPVVEPDVPVIIEPGQCVLKPSYIVSLRIVFSRVRATTFGASNSRMKADACLGKHIVEFERLGEIRIEHHRAISNAELASHCFDDVVELVQTLIQQRAVAEDSTIALHGPLHGQSDCSCPYLAL